jgi:hypothetical protein
MRAGFPKNFHVRLGALLLAAASGVARSAVVDIAWTASGRFEHTVSVAPGKFAEVCGPLESGQSVRWSFRADRPVDFNIHYHVGKDVRYPARHDAVRDAEGTLAIPDRQDYCWMWSNKAGTPAQLQVVLSK